MSQKVFKELEAKIKTEPDLVKQMKGVYLFQVTQADGKVLSWTVDLKNGSGSVSEGETGKADCTISMKEDDFVQLMTGKLNGQQAFMGGKLKIKGNMGLAMKLGKLSQQKAKL